MRDDFLDPAWATHHGSVSQTIHRLVKKLNYGFERLAERQFAAPWRPVRHHPAKTAWR